MRISKEEKDRRYADTMQALEGLFETAKKKDEFEYCCALLRIRGGEGPGWDPLQESNSLLTQTIKFASAPIDNEFRKRLILLAYCHAIEMSFIYDVIANMIQISNGERYCSGWFSADYYPNPKTEKEKKEAESPFSKIARIKIWAIETEQKRIVEILEQMLLRDVRNAFDHSDYILFADEFRFFDDDGKAKVYKLEKLLPKLEFAINIVLMLMEITRNRIRSYKENKEVPARMLDGDPHIKMMELLVDPNHGLIGFQGVIKTQVK